MLWALESDLLRRDNENVRSASKLMRENIEQLHEQLMSFCFFFSLRKKNISFYKTLKMNQFGAAEKFC